MALSIPAAGADDAYAEIHCKHFFNGYPTGTPVTNDLVIRDGYALSSNDETKFADWVACRLDCATVCGDVPQQRKWMTDPWLDEDETLESKPDDYAGASDALGVDRGHQAPLASFKGTLYWYETNYYSNITPQMSDLNQGPWVKIEDKEPDLARAGDIVYVMTGPLYERNMPGLPNADEPHLCPPATGRSSPSNRATTTTRYASPAFIFDQETPRDAAVLDYLVTVDDVEERSGLDFLWELSPAEQDRIESGTFAEWAAENFG